MSSKATQVAAKSSAYTSIQVNTDLLDSYNV